MKGHCHHRSIKKRMEFKTNLTHRNEQFGDETTSSQCSYSLQTLSNQTTIQLKKTANLENDVRKNRECKT